MSYYWGGNAYELWIRVYDERVLTDDGIYAKDEVPTDYAGPELTIQYNQLLVYANDAGQFLELSQFDYKDVKNKEDDEYEGVKYTIPGAKERVVGGGDTPEAPETLYLEGIVETPVDFDDSAAARAGILYEQYLSDRKEKEDEEEGP